MRWLRAILRRMQPIKDLLHGRWLGHSLHAALSDLPIGALTLVLVFDAFNARAAADVALGFGILTMAAAAVAGAADYSDTDDEARTSATVHSVVMTVALVLFIASLWLRLADPAADRSVPIALAVAAYVLLLTGAWIGGHVVYELGNMVNRHAWRFGAKPAWIDLDVGELAEGVPAAGKAGPHSLVVVRVGSDVYALHAQCAHAGGPLPSGRVVDGCIECPWHFSRYELATGRRTQGPTTFDQPRYEVRTADGGGYQVRRVESPGQPG